MDFDGLKDKAEGFVSEHGDQIEKAVDKAEEFAKDKVSGHDEQIEKAAAKIKGLIPDREPPPSQ
ncbi:MAG: antitoxin [Pseudonocardiales bacterium]|nr:MAG: antitoxin [Pseudonocardiales bacterium]